jgi:hypothetical protein
MAGALRRLGWFVIAGAAVASAVHGLAPDMVINSLVARFSTLIYEPAIRSS